jgi:hypothetical protein
MAKAPGFDDWPTVDTVERLSFKEEHDAPTPGHTDLMISPEAIDEALAANPLPEELANPGESLDLEALPLGICETSHKPEKGKLR